MQYNDSIATDLFRFDFHIKFLLFDVQIMNDIDKCIVFSTKIFNVNKKNVVKKTECR